MSRNHSPEYHILMSLNHSPEYHILMSLNHSPEYHILMSLNHSPEYHVLMSLNHSPEYRILMSLNHSPHLHPPPRHTIAHELHAAPPRPPPPPRDNCRHHPQPNIPKKLLRPRGPCPGRRRGNKRYSNNRRYCAQRGLRVEGRGLRVEVPQPILDWVPQPPTHLVRQNSLLAAILY